MNRRDMIRMSDEEIEAFLQGVHTLQVASIDKDGVPHLVAMWYAMIDGEVAFWTYAKSQKIVNLRRDPRLTCLVEEGKTYSELRGVQITGTAAISDDRAVVQRVGEALWERYTGPLEGNAREMVTAQGAKRVVVFVKPTRIVSWDHRKLGGRY